MLWWSFSTGLYAEALVHGMLLSDCEWRGAALMSSVLHIALGESLPFGALRTLWLGLETGPTRCAPLAFESLYHMYRKLSRCVEYVALGAGLAQASGEAVLERIESFGQDVGQWLKVAGGDKAAITDGALLGQGLEGYELSAEFGAFVGYSGIRYARSGLASRTAAPYVLAGGLVGASFEVDPVHAGVARYFIDLAGLSGSAEIWLGLLQDTVALTAERTGEWSQGFSFMDQRGTTFHEDLAQLERIRLLPPRSTVTADNVNKPGAPIFLWNMGRTPRFATQLWSLMEFASSTIEDWQSVSVSRAY